MKATLTFNLPEEKEELDDAINGTKWWCIVWEIDQKMRGIVKYDSVSDETAVIVDGLRDHLRELTYDKGLILDRN